MDNIVFRKLSYGLFAIGAMLGDEPKGCIVNTVIQITSENPIIAISMNKNNYTYEIIKKTNKFVVSILSEQTDPNIISQLGFATGKEKNKFEGLPYEIKNGLPIISESCAGYIFCDVYSMTETPTHFVILATVKDAIKGSEAPPMTYKYYHEVIRGTAPKNAPTYIKPSDDDSYVCSVCGYIYKGDITKESDDYKCPVCGASKEKFKKQDK